MHLHVIIQSKAFFYYSFLTLTFNKSIPAIVPTVRPYKAKQIPNTTRPCVVTGRVFTMEGEGRAQPSSPIPGTGEANSETALSLWLKGLPSLWWKGREAAAGEFCREPLLTVLMVLALLIRLLVANASVCLDRIRQTHAHPDRIILNIVSRQRYRERQIRMETAEQEHYQGMQIWKLVQVTAGAILLLRSCEL